MMYYHESCVMFMMYHDIDILSDTIHPIRDVFN